MERWGGSWWQIPERRRSPLLDTFAFRLSRNTFFVCGGRHHKGESGTQARVKAAVRDPTPPQQPTHAVLSQISRRGQRSAFHEVTLSEGRSQESDSVYCCCAFHMAWRMWPMKGFVVRVVQTGPPTKLMRASECVNLSRFFFFVLLSSLVACSEGAGLDCSE